MADIHRHADAAALLERAESWLLRSEAEHNLLLGLAARLRESAVGYEPPIYLETELVRRGAERAPRQRSSEEAGEYDARAADEAFREILRSGRFGWLLEVDALLNAEIDERIGESRLVESCAIFEVERSAVPIEITSTGVIGRVSILEASPVAE